MSSNILADRWIIGSIVFLIIIAAACYLWYQQDTAPYKQGASDTQELIRQWEIEKSRKSKITEQVADVAAESNTSNGEKPISQTMGIVVKDTNTESQQQAESPANTATDGSEDVPVSPFGFGPYPELGDYPYKVIWSNKDSPGAELLTRVLIKLWNEGERNFLGGSTHNGKVYPHYHDTVYVRITPIRDKDGKRRGQSTSITSGPHVQYTRAEILNPPPGLRVLDLESSGIDPYQYLNLPLRKGEK